jgi:hypothetical protein
MASFPTHPYAQECLNEAAATVRNLSNAMVDVLPLNDHRQANHSTKHRFFLGGILHKQQQFATCMKLKLHQAIRFVFQYDLKEQIFLINEEKKRFKGSISYPTLILLQVSERAPIPDIAGELGKGTAGFFSALRKREPYLKALRFIELGKMVQPNDLRMVLLSTYELAQSQNHACITP